jgi:hypothetical protein
LLDRAQPVAGEPFDRPLQIRARFSQRAETVAYHAADRRQGQARQSDLRGERGRDQSQSGAQKRDNSHRGLGNRIKRIKHG